MSSNSEKKNIGSKLLIMLAGILWGCMGLFVRPLNEKGLNSWDIVFLRAVLTTVIMAVILLIKDRTLFKAEGYMVLSWHGPSQYSIL